LRDLLFLDKCMLFLVGHSCCLWHLIFRLTLSDYFFDRSTPLLIISIIKEVSNLGWWRLIWVNSFLSIDDLNLV
jgi:hypothetical protein